MTSYIDAWADPACSGSRYVAYDFYSTASSATPIDIDSARAWVCGTIAMNVNPPGVTTTLANIWSGWSYWNSCGFQADLSTYFGGVINRWTYTNH